MNQNFSADLYADLDAAEPQPRAPSLTLDEIVDREPGVAALLAACRQIACFARDDRRFCRERAWKAGCYGVPGIKPWMRQLVGWERPQPDELRTWEAWEVVFAAVMKILPQCRCC